MKAKEILGTIKCFRCGLASGILDAQEMSDIGLGDKFCIECGFYFYAIDQNKSNVCSRAIKKTRQ